MAWVGVTIGGLLEIGWAVGLKYTEGFTRLGPSLATVASMVASMAMLGIAVNSLPVGTAYAVWTAALGIALFGDPATFGRLACIGLIVAGIAGLKLVS